MDTLEQKKYSKNFLFFKLEFLRSFSRHFCICFLSIFSCLSILIPSAQASDLEVYRQVGSGQRTMMLMIDVSQAMGTDPVVDLKRDYPLCLGGGVLEGVKSVLKPIATIDLDLLGLISIHTGTLPTDNYCEIPALLVSQILEAVDGVSGRSLLGLQGTTQYIKDSCEPVKNPTLGIISTYRCYNRLQRIKLAINDLMDGNPEKGISALPTNIKLGVSVYPATKTSGGKNELAGMIAVEANLLDATQRTKIKTAINGLQSVNPVNSVLTSAAALVSSLLTLNLTNVVKLLVDILITLPSNIDNLLGMSVPTATAYAETGAYLLGNTSKGTGAIEIGRASRVNISFLEVGGSYQTCTRNDPETGACLVWSAASVSILGIGQPDWYRYQCSSTRMTGCHDWPKDSSLLSLSIGVPKSFYYYNNDLNYSSAYSGFTQSVAASKRSTNLYTETLKESECKANGIFVLTGTIPDLSPSLIDWLVGSQNEPLDSNGVATPVQKIMNRSLKSDGSYGFQCGSLPSSAWNGGSSSATWPCIANYASALKNNTDFPVKTAVGGIGREFSHLASAKSTADLNVTKTPDLISSLFNVLIALLNGVDALLTPVNDLLKLLGVNLDLDQLLPRVLKALNNVLPLYNNEKDIANVARWGIQGGGGWYQLSSSKNIADSIKDFSDNLVTNTEPVYNVSTIPEDPLTPYNLEAAAYNSMFISTNQQSWFGNLKKYSTVVDGTVNLSTVADEWAKSSTFTDILSGGVKAKLAVATNDKESTRKIYVNRLCNIDQKAYVASTSKLTQVSKDYFNTTCSNNRDARREDLMALLGYKVQLSGTDAQNLKETLVAEPKYQQVGMPLHSTPIKITQSGAYDNEGKLSREDYIVFGSTQGLLHVVDASSGTEKFAFVPNEMLDNEKQRKAFTGNSLSDYGSYFSNMQYGVDGPWVAYTEYVSSTTDSRLNLTVGTLGEGNSKIIGKQWLYGGLRMGGRSYYALDLGDIDQPKMKFHINPDAATTGTPLSYMGQSWSKPTVAWVKWKGVRKLVMFVGGGYDATGTFTCTGFTALNNKGYECPTYQQTNGKGAGVYMFDANNGDLLWWTSANATASNTGTAKFTTNADMKYSVVSRINTKDRDGDGLVDHLYFGDLGGQVWRADLNNNLASDSTADFATHVVKLLNLHATDGTSPRFYEAPNFSVYGYGTNTLAVISIAAGNRSLPVSDVTSIGAIYNIFDRDVTKTSLYSLSANQLSSTVNTLGNGGLIDLSNISNLTASNLPTYGWYQKLTIGYKVMGEMAVLNKSLYASIYDPSGGSVAKCGVGTKGQTSVQRYCLPYGVCEKGISAGQVVMGKGILPLTLGAGINGDKATRQLIGGNLGDRTNTSTNAANVLNENTIRRQIVPLKWYEQDSP